MSLKTDGKDGDEDITSQTGDDEKGWKSHRLVFEKPELEKCVVDPVLKQEEEYVVYDPLKDIAHPNLSRHDQRLGLGKMSKDVDEKW